MCKTVLWDLCEIEEKFDYSASANNLGHLVGEKWDVFSKQNPLQPFHDIMVQRWQVLSTGEERTAIEGMESTIQGGCQEAASTWYTVAPTGIGW
jgi:hypothetical protein